MNTTEAPDSGGMVLGWLTKVVVVLSVLGFISFDGFALLAARVTVGDTADEAAQAASDAWQQTHNGAATYTAAEKVAKSAGSTIPDKGVQIAGDGTVTVVVNKQAKTFILHHIARLNSAEKVTGHGSARPMS